MDVISRSHCALGIEADTHVKFLTTQLCSVLAAARTKCLIKFAPKHRSGKLEIGEMSKNTPSSSFYYGYEKNFAPSTSFHAQMTRQLYNIMRLKLSSTVLNFRKKRDVSFSTNVVNLRSTVSSFLL